MSHIIPVIIAVLIANAISQSLELSIYDSIIQIKKLPFLPPILSTSSAAHHIHVEDIMVRDVAYIWRNCTYRDLKNVLKSHRSIQSFPLVDDGSNMILLGSVQRIELSLLASQRLSRERRLQEVRRRYSIQDTLMQVAEKAEAVAKSQSLPKEAVNSRRMSRFEVTPVQQQFIDGKASPNRLSPKAPVKSILKHTVSFTYSPHSTVTLTAQDSRLRHAFENIFFKSLKLQDANPDKKLDKSSSPQNTLHRRVQLPRERVIDMSPEEQLAWEEEQLNSIIDFSSCRIDPAPFQLVEKTTLLKVHSIFSMLGLNHAYVTSIGRLVGVVALKDLRTSIEKMNAGLLVPNSKTNANNLNGLESDANYEDTVTSVATNDSQITRQSDQEIETNSL